METSYKNYYNEQLEAGKEFQDFVSDELQKIGIIFAPYGSKKYQLKKGENRLGLEVKLDRKFRQTGNLYIEIAEKSDPTISFYSQSGLMRTDNTWLYLIGDFQEAYIFGKKYLKDTVLSCKKVQTETSVGFLLPLQVAESCALMKINFSCPQEGIGDAGRYK